jgi:ribosomal protein L7/L12
MSTDEYDELNARIKQLEKQVSFLLRHFQIDVDAAVRVPEFAAVQDLINQDKVIEAIAQYRRETGVGLREAKMAVDQMRGQMGR